jgi:hypothetical protein
MHEVFFTRGDLQQSGIVVKHEAHVATNVVLVHPGGNTSPCHAYAHTKEGQKDMIANILKWEGYERTKRWLQKMKKYVKGPMANKALLQLEEVHYEVQNLQKGSG